MKRIISALMTFLLIFLCMATGLAASFADIVGDWAEDEIEYMIGKNVLNGYPEDGTFKPKNPVKRAEYIKMICETFGLTETTEINFMDVTPDKWFYVYIQKAAAQGFLLNYGTKLNPEGEISRQEAAALLVRYLDLDPNKKDSVSKYPDYSKIKSAYRDYVLQASYEGIFGGREDGTFDPDATLQRREAAAILYRVAGTIYRGSATGVESGAADQNAIVSAANVTVTGASIPHRMVISEGVTTGSVTLKNCTIGELIIRGKATVVLSEGTTVDSMIMDTDSTYAINVNLSGSSSIKTATLRTPAKINVGSGSVLDTLTVEKTAEGSFVKGSGTFKSATIKASRFTSDRVPTTYDIASGLSATFNDTTYTGNSASATNTGFSATPETVSTASAVYLTVSPANRGTVYYYFSNSSTAPSKTTFDSLYNVSGMKSSFAVTAGDEKNVNIGSGINIGAYPYVVVMLRDQSGTAFNPVVIANKASTGFSAAPTVSTSNGYHYLAYTPLSDGTVYYFYTNNSTAMSASDFSTTYNSANTPYKGKITVTASQSASSPTLAANRISGYSYIALLLEDNQGDTYQPLVISTSETQSALGNGFIAEPTTALTGSGVQLTFVAAQVGSLQYYFSTSNVCPTSAQFDTNLNMAGASLSGGMTVDAGIQTNVVIGDTTVATQYPHLVVRLTSGTTRYEPVVISTAGVSVDLANSGFATIPVVSVSNGYYAVTLSTTTSCAVYYYLTNSTSVSTATVFNQNYTNATSSYLSSPTGGQLVSAGYAQTTMQTVVPVSTQSGYKYMALLVSTVPMGSTGTTWGTGASTGTGYWGTTGTGSSYWGTGSTTGSTVLSSYTPIVVPLPDNAGDMLKTESIFTMGPSYYQYSADVHQVEFTSARDGRLYYYYTDYPEEENASDIVADILFGQTANPYAGIETVRSGQNGAIAVYRASSEYPQYMMLIYVDSNNNIYTPLTISTDASSASNMSTSGFNGTPTVQREYTTAAPTLTYNVSQSGTVYYYFSTNATVPANATSFMTAYNASTTVGGKVTIGIGRGTVALNTSYSTASYPYVVMMFQLSTGGTGGYRKPIVVSVTGTGSTGSTTSTAFNGTPVLSGNTLYFTPMVAGTFFCAVSDTNSLSDWTSSFSQARSMASMYSGTMATDLTTSQYFIQMYGGASQTVSYGVQQTMTNVQPGTKPYLVMWIVSSAGSVTTPAFISTTGNSSWTGTGTGTTGSFTSGFAVTPTYNASTNQVTFATTSAGYVQYIFTNVSTASMTNQEFSTLCQNYPYDTTQMATTASLTTVSASHTSIYGYSYKYMWFQFTASTGTQYLPICVQIAG